MIVKALAILKQLPQNRIVSMKYLSFILVVLVFASCKPNRLDLNVSDIEIDNSFVRFDQLIFNVDSAFVLDSLIAGYANYPDFVSLYTEDIIRVGKLNSASFDSSFLQFYNDTVIARVAKRVLERFNEFNPIADELKNGFRHLKYYFPNKTLPDVYTYVSGFNQSLVVADDYIGISLDKYLGADCIFYTYLGIPQYKSAKMYPEKMVTDLFYAYALTEFPNTESSDNLLSNMIYEGKLMYFTEAMNPDLPDSVLIGYSAQELDWCKEHEGIMWEYLAEKKLLYSVERLDLQKFIGDAPFTSTFTKESPGRTGVWLGWQIVRSFMNQNPELSLAELMELANSQEILGRSKYFPN